MGSVEEFIAESNAIEGIHRPPSEAEIAEYERFMALDDVTIADLEIFVSVYQPGARLRIAQSDNVRIGKHIPPHGGMNILYLLEDLLNAIDEDTPYRSHAAYEGIHPFTDCNGRSGRMLWAWHMNKLGLSTALGFLHTFYYQTLAQEHEHG